MTRMWLVNPATLCRNHLLGEHKEIHQLAGQIRLGKMNQVKGLADKGCVDTSVIETRHDELAAEIVRRGWNHRSPIERIKLTNHLGSIDIPSNMKELRTRCEICRKRQKNQQLFLEAALEYLNPSIKRCCRIISWRWNVRYDDLIAEAYFQFTRLYLAADEIFDESKLEFHRWMLWRIRSALLDYTRKVKKEQKLILRESDLQSDCDDQGNRIIDSPIKDSTFPYEELSEDAKLIVDLILSNNIDLLRMVFDEREGPKTPYLTKLKEYLRQHLNWSVHEIKNAIQEIRRTLK